MCLTPRRADHAVVPVEQVDREAAADWCCSQPFPSKQVEGPMIRAGEYDHHSLVQAFARHRLAAAPKPAMAGSKEVREAVASLLGSWVIHAAEDPEDNTVLHDEFVGDYENRTAELYRLTDAILALTAEGRDDVLREAAKRCIQIVERNLYRQTEKVEDVPKILRAALSTPEER